MLRWIIAAVTGAAMAVLLVPAAPAHAATAVHWVSRDAIPSPTEGVRKNAEVVVRTVVPWVDAPPASFVLRNAAGTAVETRTVAAVCPRDLACVGDNNNRSEYRWTWTGRRTDGTLRPAGRYTLTARIPDGSGGTTTEQLGSTYLRHLATVKGIQRWSPAEQNSFTKAGRCSTVVLPGPHGWTGSVGLLSGSRCRSTAGTDDLAAQYLWFSVDGSLVERVVGWRLDAYGEPVRAGSRAVLLGRSTRGWQTSAVLGRGLGWHNGTTRTSGIGSWQISEDGERSLLFHARASTTDGSRYDVKFLRTVLDYRTWVR